MKHHRLRRYAAPALVVIVLLVAVNHVRPRGGQPAANAGPARNTTTTAYVPAVVRGDPLPVVANPDGVSASQSGSTLQGLALSAPGAKADDVMGLVLYAAGGTVALPPIADVKVRLYPGYPSWLYLQGRLDRVNAALAALQYEPTRAPTHVLYLVLTNDSLGTNARKVSVPIRLL